MREENPNRSYYDEDEEKKTPFGTIALIVLALALLGAVGYDIYLRMAPAQVLETSAPPVPSPSTADLQNQVELALTRASENAEETVMWRTVARAAAGIAGVRPPTLLSVQRAIFINSDEETRQFLREYFKNPANVDKLTEIVVYIARLTVPGPMTREFLQACQPLFNEPLPDTAPLDPNANWCYEFLLRRQNEGGDVVAWQRLLGAGVAEIFPPPAPAVP